MSHIEFFVVLHWVLQLPALKLEATIDQALWKGHRVPYPSHEVN